MTARRYWVVESRNAASPTGLWYLTFGVFGGFGPNPEAMTCFLGLDREHATKFYDRASARHALEHGREIQPNWKTNGNKFTVRKINA